MHVKTALLLFTATAIVSACASEEPDRYTVAWQMGADAYDEAKAEATLSRCTDLPGAARGGAEPDSLPPVPQLTFQGSDRERTRFEDCLLALDDAVVYGPVTPEDDRPRAPVLER